MCRTTTQVLAIDVGLVPHFLSKQGVLRIVRSTKYWNSGSASSDLTYEEWVQWLVCVALKHLSEDSDTTNVTQLLDMMHIEIE